MIAGLVPIGGGVFFLKSYSNTPSLATQKRNEYLEFNGQTISDANSPYNGQVWPDLNGSLSGTKRFLRGSTSSGTTGGADCPTINLQSTFTTNSITVDTNLDGITNSALSGAGFCPGTINPNTLPSYYEIVWIGRVK